ncbi:MAG: hypothetical protein ACR2MX_15085 [Cyclobacteriaceae bacterium]
MIGLLIVIWSRVGLAQGPPLVDPLFSSDSLIEVNIVANIKGLLETKHELPEIEYPGHLWYLNEIGDTVSLKIKIETRGITRKKVCRFPPVRLNFQKKKVKSTLFENQDKLKLVTHCRESDQFSSYLNKEYLVYRMYNELTDYSYQVRMLKVNYIDSAGSLDTINDYAFAIEHKDRMAARNQSIPLDRKGIHPKLLSRYTYGLMSMYQFMIGNTDWNEPSLHNLRLIKLKDPTKIEVVAVPYDFDFCGLVNTSYASPTEGLSISNVTERLYRGKCLSGEEYQKVIEKFNQKKGDMFAICDKAGHLTEKERKGIIKYLDQFYHIINSKNGLANTVLRNCRPDTSYH